MVRKPRAHPHNHRAHFRTPTAPPLQYRQRPHQRCPQLSSAPQQQQRKLLTSLAPPHSTQRLTAALPTQRSSTRTPLSLPPRKHASQLAWRTLGFDLPTHAEAARATLLQLRLLCLDSIARHFVALKAAQH